MGSAVPPTPREREMPKWMTSCFRPAKGRYGRVMRKKALRNAKGGCARSEGRGTRHEQRRSSPPSGLVRNPSSNATSSNTIRPLFSNEDGLLASPRCGGRRGRHPARRRAPLRRAGAVLGLVVSMRLACGDAPHGHRLDIRRGTVAHTINLLLQWVDGATTLSRLLALRWRFSMAAAPPLATDRALRAGWVGELEAATATTLTRSRCGSLRFADERGLALG